MSAPRMDPFEWVQQVAEAAELFPPEQCSTAVVIAEACYIASSVDPDADADADIDRLALFFALLRSTGHEIARVEA